MAGLEGLFGGIGGAVGGLFSYEGDMAQAKGDFAAAQDFTTASQIAQQNAKITLTAGDFKLAQESRKINLTEGAASAIEGGANVQGGSAGDILRDTIHQGGIAKSLISLQTSIDYNSFQEQSLAYKASAEQAQAAGEAAKSAATGALIGGGLKLLTGIVGMF